MATGEWESVLKSVRVEGINSHLAKYLTENSGHRFWGTAVLDYVESNGLVLQLIESNL